MPSVCFYFQVHQPFRLARYSFISPPARLNYFDDDKNIAVLRKVAHKCYLPTNELMLRLIDRHKGRFRISYSITGVVLEQMERWAPEVIESFQALVKTGCVELLSETYHHSLASVYDLEEFREQIALHTKLMKRLFGVTPNVFRNTELIYADFIGREAGKLGYKGVIAEGADDILGWRSPHFVYEVPEDAHNTALLLKSYRLSDDVAFRFSNRSWADFPLSAEKYASWLHAISGNGDTINLFMDYETFGEHQWESTGIFAFLEHLPAQVLRHPDWNFATPSEVIATYPKRAALPFNRITSWADVDRDLTAWKGNSMQERALAAAFRIGDVLRTRSDVESLATWRKLLTSDHFYYMCTKWFADGDVHAYFSPYESPYEGFLNYMNILRQFALDVALEYEFEQSTLAI